jgi:hypothetical protein
MRQGWPSHATQTAVAVSARAQGRTASTTGSCGGSSSIARAATAWSAGLRAFMGNARLPMISSVRAAALARIDAAHSPPCPAGRTAVKRLDADRTPVGLDERDRRA